MLQIHDFGEIKTRAEAIGVSLKDLARDVGVHHSTAYRGARGGDLKISTVRKLERALVERERRALAHLLLLHPDMGLRHAA